jgi:hypothetical protein
MKLDFINFFATVSCLEQVEFRMAFVNILFKHEAVFAPCSVGLLACHAYVPYPGFAAAEYTLLPIKQFCQNQFKERSSAL